MKTNLVRIAALVSALFASTSCSSIVEPGEELASARSRWAQHGLASYTMTIRRGCECPAESVGPVVVTVQNGAISARYELTGAPVPKSYAALFPDVEGLFNTIEHALDQNYYKLDVEYDPELGYPTSISVDQIKQAIDDEYFTIVRDFKAN